MFTNGRIAEAVKYLADTVKDEDKRTQTEVNALKVRIAKLQREADNLNRALMSVTEDERPKSTLKLLADREKAITELEKQIADLRSGPKQGGFKSLALTDGLVQSIRAETLAVLDNESPDNLRRFLRSYIERITILENSVSFKFTFQESPNSSQLMVAGVGFEPTAFGL